MLGPGVDRRRAERDAGLLGHGIRELLADHEIRLVNELIQGRRAGTLTPTGALEIAAALTALRDLLGACERARRNLRPQEVADGVTTARA
jgi:hypothetical protein